ncbi:Hydroxymethylpyrimidine pyrophosphatase [Paramicrobacterium humi]|uniref:Hydroxymethylpyrimidine pyrophosphatase n=1 Tax=Paramicrobacterium humi TaxID=640635 RepID=A0A1H4MTP2_9MICO|nr:hypothetical protein [Microbacterium humi]SEB86313.1 Hydroxymethylpyrimidine pyrophosphatase [Microbacterium humi]
MTDFAPDLGLLLDVDGPIASPVSRTVAIETIAPDLVTLANAGVPIAFNTGRSDGFLREQLIPPLRAAGLADDALVWGICEKGAVWMRITAHGEAELSVDEELRMPPAFTRDIERLVDASYSDLVFFDHTKRAMVSVEQRTDVSNEEYLDRQGRFNADVAEVLERHDLGFEWEGERHPDAAGSVGYRIDPTIISTDIESNRVGKDLGASRMMQFLADEGVEAPHRWRTMGDSRTDYAMADWLHDNGFEVAHVDVRPSDGVPEGKPYPIRQHSSLIHDESGALYVRRWVEMVRGEAADDADV